ncbi:MAG TPA: bifunctional glutamate N-acetyltransferase/amino-acid acetyltransferase ArgJ [Terriglobales bacterium]|nr:bifunctional glutamate N-acetyltransferase/amino-acid acetyltransferase ArgJ [Terriglobales bacterium]
MSDALASRIQVPAGFEFSAVACGIKASGNLDLALALARDGATAAAVFTRNLVAAAPIAVGRKHLRASGGRLRAVLVNSGNANCATGRPGLDACNRSCAELARAGKIRKTEVLPSSTGVIGVPFPVHKVSSGIPLLLQSISGSPEAVSGFVRAIMTTDTRPKVAGAAVTSGGKRARIFGCAKGAGMIHPNLATMLAYLFTDVEATAAQLRGVLASLVERTFNRISIDGDTSTNDTVLLMASGKSGLKLNSQPSVNQFAKALAEVCASLAEQIVRDGEGVKHLVRLRIEGARNEGEADRVAQVIATSPLVKTAWAGADPNWGRILAAVGRSGISIDPGRVSIAFGPQYVCKRGVVADFDENAIHEYLSRPEVEIRVHLGRGRAAVAFLTCDLTAEYVRINADYRT